MTANFFFTQAGTHIRYSFTVHDLIPWESKVQAVVYQGAQRILFTLESWFILIHGSRLVLLQLENLFELRGT